MSQLTPTNPGNQVSRTDAKARSAALLHDAARVADAYNGPSPVDYFRGHSDFDFPDVMTGELLHDPECPYCRLRNLKRAYGMLLALERRKSRHEYQ